MSRERSGINHQLLGQLLLCGLLTLVKRLEDAPARQWVADFGLEGRIHDAAGAAELLQQVSVALIHFPYPGRLLCDAG